MKKILLLVSLVCFLGAAYGQNPYSNKWVLKKVGISFGQDQDMLMGLSHEKLMNSIVGDPQFHYDDIPFGKQDVYSMVCENPHYRLEATFLPPGSKHSEIRLAAVGIFNRIDGVYYQAINPENQEYATLSFDSWSNEIAVEAAYLYRLSLGNVLNLYGGGGMNVGTTFGSNMSIYGSNLNMTRIVEPEDPSDIPYVVDYYDNMTDNYNKHEGFTRRLFMQLGASFVVGQRIEIGYEKRLGYGYNWIPLAGSFHTTKLRSNAITLKYHFKLRNQLRHGA